VISTRSAVSSADNLDQRCQAGLEAIGRTQSAADESVLARHIDCKVMHNTCQQALDTACGPSRKDAAD
jgi:hypothetical protein